MIQNSLILGLIVRFWNAVCRAAEGSFLQRFWLWLQKAFKHGLVYKLVTGPVRLDEVWEKSLLCRFLTWLLNIVPRIGRFLFGEKRKTAQSSLFFTKIAPRFDLVSAAFVGVLLVLILATPHYMWNNFYALALGLLALCCLWLSRFQNGSVTMRFVGAWPALFLVVYMLSALWSQSFATSYKYVFYSFSGALLLVVCTNCLKSAKRLEALCLFCAVGIIACSAFAMMQRVRGISVSASYTDLSVNAGMPGRVYSFFDNPNTFASVLVMFSPLMLTMAVYSRTWRKKALYLLAFGLSAAALIMTYSRGAWLAYAFSMFVLALILCPRWVPLFIVLGVLALPVLPANIQNRLFSIFSSDSSIDSRNYIYSSVVRLLKDNWLFGVGLGSTGLQRGVAVFHTFEADFYFVHAHNIFLEVWGESGILALVTFVGAMFTSIKKGFKAVKKTAGPLRGVLTGTGVGLLGAMIFGMTDNLWAYPRVLIIFWFLVAILLTAAAAAGEINGKAE